MSLSAQGEAGAPQTILFQHAFQYLHVAGDVHGIVLEEAVQLLLKALHHLIHHTLDALFGGGDVLTLYPLSLQLGIGAQNL